MKLLIFILELSLLFLKCSQFSIDENVEETTQIDRSIIEQDTLNFYLEKIATNLAQISNLLGTFLDTKKVNEINENILECESGTREVTCSRDFVELAFNDSCVCSSQLQQPCSIVWNISTNDISKIEIELQDLEMKSDGQCVTKSLNIYDNFCFINNNNNNENSNNSNSNNECNKSIFTSCSGKFPPPNLISSHNYVLVLAQANRMTSLPAFRLRHRKVVVEEPQMEKVQMDKKISLIMAQSDKAADTCPEEATVLTTDYGVIYSPNYQFGKKYPNEASCSWLINVDPGKIIILTIISFSLEPAFPITNQCFDYVKVYDSAQPDRSKLYGTYCGSGSLKPPNTLRSTSNQMLILFESDEVTNEMGFAAKYSSALLDPVTTKSAKENKILSCGKPVIQPKIYNRIVGGVEAVAHSWPWMVSIRLAGEHICGGALLDENWVVTAAHCLLDQNMDLLDVVLGDHNSSLVEGTEEFRNIHKTIIHDSYSSVTSDFDIGLLRLDKPATMNSNIQPICLRKMPTTSKISCVVCGWGKTRDSGPENVLNQLLVPLIDTELCTTWYRGFFTNNMMCAGYAEGRRDSCQGDSGGPLVCTDGKLWHLSGVTSWGFDCAKPKRPGVYTNVTNFLDWIISNAVD